MTTTSRRTVATATTDAPRLQFAGHQTYPLRSSWLTRALLALAQAEREGNTSRFFAFPDATDRFGLGPSMIHALRYWLRATGVMVEQPGQGVRRIPTLTPLGTLLAEVDPYLERTGSLWLLHDQLIRQRVQAPTWYWFFQCFLPTRGKATSFSTVAALEALLAWSIKEAPRQHMAPGALKKDLDCLLRLYVPTRLLSPEQAGQASPFHPLGLLQAVPCAQEAERAERCFCARPPYPEQLPPLLVLALLLAREGPAARLPLARLKEPGHLEATFALSASRLLDICATLQDADWRPQLAQSGRQEWLTLPPVEAEQVLQRYYAHE